MESFGETPFDIVHKRNKLFTRSNDVPTTSSVHNNSATEDTTIVDLYLQEFLDHSSDGDSIETSWLAGVNDPPSNHQSDNLGTAEPDPESLKELETLLALTTDYASWPQAIRSRVLMDVWHAIARIKVPKEHGFQQAFAIALQDAIFIPNAEDKTHITAYLHSKNSGWEEKLHTGCKKG